MAKRSKASNLKEKEMLKVAEYYLNAPGQHSYRSVAFMFKCTHYQVRNAVAKYKELKFKEAVAEKSREVVDKEREGVRDEIKRIGALDLVDEAIVDTIALIRANKSMDVLDRIKYINQLTIAMKRVSDLLFVEAVKKPDAQKVIKLCQLIDPQITEAKILELWKRIELSK